MRLQLFSDMHRDFSRRSLGSILAPDNDSHHTWLINAGDFCNRAYNRLTGQQSVYFEQLEQYKDQWGYKGVISVFGNHENYLSMVNPKGLKNYFPSDPVKKIYYLEDEYLEVEPGEFIYGATMWPSFLNEPDEKNLFFIERGMTDFRQIEEPDMLRKGTSPYGTVIKDHSIDKCRQYFDESIEKFFKFMDERKPTDKVVLLMHFAPFKKSIHPKYQDSEVNAYFWIGMEHRGKIFNYPQLKAILHGHTHSSFDYTYKGIRVWCNPYGYESARGLENPEFNDRLIIGL